MPGICSSKSNDQENGFDNKMPAMITVIQQQTLHILRGHLYFDIEIHKKILPNILMNM